MAVKTGKALKAELGERLLKAADMLGETVKSQTSRSGPQMSDRLKEILEQMRADNEAVTVNIYKQNDLTKEFGAFTQLSNLDPTELKGNNLQMICRNEGGRGNYRVGVVLPDGHEEYFGPFSVWGAESYNAPKLEREALGQAQGATGMGLPVIPLPGQLPAMAQAQTHQAQMIASSFGGPSYRMEDGKYFQRTTDQVLKQEAAQQDKMLVLLMSQQQQQQAAAQQMNQMLATMFGGLLQVQQMNQGTGKVSAESDALKEMQARLDRMEQQRIADEKFNLLMKTSDDKMAMLAKQLDDSKKGKPDESLQAIIQAFGMVGQLNQANNQMQMKVMEQLTNKSGEQGFIIEMTKNMMQASIQQVNMVQQLAEAGLLGEQGPGLKDYIKQAIGAGAQIVKAMVANSAGGRQAQQLEAGAGAGMGFLPPAEEGGEYEDEQEVQQEPQPQAQQPQVQPQQPQQPKAQPQAQGVGDLLTKDELDIVERDSALAKIVAIVTGGGPIPEASQRVFIHARSQNRVAIKWLSNPVAITAQVMLHFGATEDRVDEACHDILAYIQYINANGDPETWAGTGYRSKRLPYRVLTHVPATVAVPASVSQPPPPVVQPQPQPQAPQPQPQPQPQTELETTEGVIVNEQEVSQ